MFSEALRISCSWLHILTWQQDIVYFTITKATKTCCCFCRSCVATWARARTLLHPFLPLGCQLQCYVWRRGVNSETGWTKGEKEKTIKQHIAHCLGLWDLSVKIYSMWLKTLTHSWSPADCPRPAETPCQSLLSWCCSSRLTTSSQASNLCGCRTTGQETEERDWNVDLNWKVTTILTPGINNLRLCIHPGLHQLVLGFISISFLLKLKKSEC